MSDEKIDHKMEIRWSTIKTWLDTIRLQQRASTRKSRKITRLKATIKELQTLTDALNAEVQKDYDCYVQVLDMLGGFPEDSPLAQTKQALDAYKKFKADRRKNVK